MRRVLFILFAGGGVIVGGCAGSELIRPPTDPPPLASQGVSLNASGAPTLVSTAVITDAIDRLVPALGPPGDGLGAPLKHLRDGDQVDATLLEATLRQLAALQRGLSLDRLPDADALVLELEALRDSAAK